MYVGYEVESKWEKAYLFSSWEGLTLLIMLALPWVLFQVLRRPRGKKVMKVIAVSMSAVAFLYAGLHLIVPMQDFVPSYGMLLLLLLLPLMITMILLERMEHRMKTGSQNENILDADDLD